MDEEILLLLQERDNLSDAAAKVRASDVSDEVFSDKIGKINDAIRKIDSALRKTGASEINEAAKALSFKTRSAANHVLENVLAGLRSEVQDVAAEVSKITREMTDNPVMSTPVTATKPLLTAPVSDDPVLLRQSHGSREVSGHLVGEMQVGLERLGFDPQGIDMIFGEDTANTLLDWRLATNRTETNAILTMKDWKELSDSPAPQLFDICAQTTAAFEGHGFGKIVGDFDGAVLTWGYHGYTLLYGHLQAVLNKIRKASPRSLEMVFGSERATELISMLDLPRQEQLIWARETVLNSSKRVRPDWHKQFASLGALNVTRKMQLQHSKEAFWQKMALPQAALMGLREPLSLGMLFDAAIQQGGASSNAVALVNSARAATPGITEMTLRKILADALIGQISNERFRKDVAERRKSFVSGRGRVHGATYDLGYWGFFAEFDENETGLTDAIIKPMSVAPKTLPIGFEGFFTANVSPVAPNFTASEFLTKGWSHLTGKCKGLNTDPPQELWENCVDLARILQRIREKADAPVTINSCYRSNSYNKCVGGAANSQHKFFKAADITIENGKTALSWYKLILELRNQGLFVGGVGRYKNFIHVDVRGANADWIG